MLGLVALSAEAMVRPPQASIYAVTKNHNFIGSGYAEAPHAVFLI